MAAEASFIYILLWRPIVKTKTAREEEEGLMNGRRGKNGHVAGDSAGGKLGGSKKNKKQPPSAQITPQSVF